MTRHFHLQGPAELSLFQSFGELPTYGAELFQHDHFIPVNPKIASPSWIRGIVQLYGDESKYPTVGGVQYCNLWVSVPHRGDDDWRITGVFFGLLWNSMFFVVRKLDSPARFMKISWWGSLWANFLKRFALSELGCENLRDAASIPKAIKEKTSKRGIVGVLLLMEGILHHLGCTNPVHDGINLLINWCRISSINSRRRQTKAPSQVWFATEWKE